MKALGYRTTQYTDKTKFNQARELYLMNAVGVSYQNFERTKFKKLSE